VDGRTSHTFEDSKTTLCLELETSSLVMCESVARPVTESWALRLLDPCEAINEAQTT